jgi:hypothetical protein
MAITLEEYRRRDAAGKIKRPMFIKGRDIGGLAQEFPMLQKKEN